MSSPIPAATPDINDWWQVTRRAEKSREGTLCPHFTQRHVTWSILPRAICAQWETKWHSSLHLPKEWKPLITTISIIARTRSYARTTPHPLVAQEHGWNGRDGSLRIQWDFYVQEQLHWFVSRMRVYIPTEARPLSQNGILGQKCKQTYITLFAWLYKCRYGLHKGAQKQTSAFHFSSNILVNQPALITLSAL